jgi:UPF0271 protein
VKTIDLNCDLGEGAGQDAALMPLITSANIACGVHAGDPATMRATAELAREHGVAVGAHPGFDDREHLGRLELRLATGEVRALVAEQLATLRAVGPVRHLKPHGGLYTLAARDRGVAAEIVDAIEAVDRRLILFALAGSVLAAVGRERGLRVAEEVFADRTYRPDGQLTPRSEPDALIVEPAAMIAQLRRMIETGTVRATQGAEVPITADTVCLHGDGPRAVAFAHEIRTQLAAAGVAIRPVFA